MQRTVCIPVSYTHLDVYKRQVLERAHRGNDNNGGGLDARQAALDVEEFFRDVYKRQRQH